MSARARGLLFLGGGAGSAVLLLWGLAGLPAFGRYRGQYGLILNRSAVSDTGATNVVASVTFDYRGFDTMIEEFILFAAVVGVALLLRAQREEAEAPAEDRARHRHAPHDSDAVRELALGLVAPAVLAGIYVVAHGHLTPGGGFQGGVVLASAPLFMYLGGKYQALRRLTPETLVEAAEGSGAGGYVVGGLVGIALGTPFMTNVLGQGRPGALLSGGMIPVLNLAVGLAVAAGFVLLVGEFLEQTLELRRRSKTR
jgi:multicomponent Na+:H+ antiporter subunit B